MAWLNKDFIHINKATVFPKANGADYSLASGYLFIVRDGTLMEFFGYFEQGDSEQAINFRQWRDQQQQGI